MVLSGVSVVRQGRALLDGIDWTICSGERWALIGPNGSGKTTLLQVVGARLWPTAGTVQILGERLGHVDMRSLRRRVAVVSPSVIRQLRPDITVREVVVTGRSGALEAWWQRYAAEAWEEADRMLARGGVDGIAGRAFGVISEGERQHVLLARALMARPELLLLDEPAAGLDLGARERLLRQLGSLAADEGAPSTVLVTHHLEEIPTGVSHAVLLREGRVLAQGEIAEVLTTDTVSKCFRTQVDVGRGGGRWWSRSPLM